MSFTWEGRQIKTAVANGKNLSYTYNDSGIRTSKTVGGVTTSYFLDGSTILAQRTGNDVLWFLYDSDGTRVGFTYNGTTYYYMTNAQGDVTGIVDSNDEVVVEYNYDAWGKLLSTTGSMENTIGKLNPFLYRGYYVDSETGLYYLNSRYYDSQTGRFLNADETSVLQATQGEILGSNLFAYCGNNPVINEDPTGYFYVSLGTMGKILIAFGLNPIAAVFISIGIYKLRSLLIGLYTRLITRLVAFCAPLGPVFQLATFVFGAAVGVQFIPSFVSALWDCVFQRKRGIEFGLKRTWCGVPYGFNIYAR